MVSLKAFDLFQKTEEHNATKTLSGGVVSLVTAATVAVVLLAITVDYFSVQRVETIGVDRSFGVKLDINVDLVFPSSPCRFVFFDVVDSTGEEQLAVDDIRKSSIRSQWSKLREGCHVKGALHVSKVAGNFHFALGQGVPGTATGEAMSTDPFAVTKVGAQHQHRFNMFELQNFNASHEFRRLSFGREYPGMPPQPLDGTAKYVESGVGQYNYYINVVPTVYTKLNGDEIHTNQYSYTEKVVEVKSTEHRFPHPGVFCYLSISPLVVRITEQHKSFLHFFSEVCAVVGAAWVVAGLLESFVSAITARLAQMGVSLGSKDAEPRGAVAQLVSLARPKHAE